MPSVGVWFSMSALGQCRAGLACGSSSFVPPVLGFQQVQIVVWPSSLVLGLRVLVQLCIVMPGRSGSGVSPWCGASSLVGLVL